MLLQSKASERRPSEASDGKQNALLTHITVTDNEFDAPSDKTVTSNTILVHIRDYTDDDRDIMTIIIP